LKQSPNFGSRFGGFKGKLKNPSFCLNSLNGNFWYLTLNRSYGLVMLVDRLLNGIL
jgi:hypothetical protein